MIVEVRGYRVECSLPEALGNALGFYNQRSSLIIEVLDDDGRSGWGEAWHSPEATSAIIRGGLADAILGQPSTDYARLWDAMTERLGYDRRGVGLMAVSGLDMAIWDLRARQLGVSIATLLGGRRRSRAFAYAAGPYFRPDGDPYRSYVEESAAYVQRGFRALKMKIGVSPKDDERAVAAVRSAVGEGIAIMVDINQGYTATSSISTARRIEPFEIVWMEEPVGPADLEGYRRISSHTRIPIAGGEALAGAAAFSDLIRYGEPEFVQPDLSVCGGFSEAQRIAVLADVHGRVVIPHVWGTGINALASLQWVAALPNRQGPASAPFPWFEYDQSPNPLRDFVSLPKPDVDGTIKLPSGEGLGMTISPELFSSYIVDAWNRKA